MSAKPKPQQDERSCQSCRWNITSKYNAYCLWFDKLAAEQRKPEGWCKPEGIFWEKR